MNGYVHPHHPFPNYYWPQPQSINDPHYNHLPPPTYGYYPQMYGNPAPNNNSRNNNEDGNNGLVMTYEASSDSEDSEAVAIREDREINLRN